MKGQRDDALKTKGKRKKERERQGKFRHLFFTYFTWDYAFVMVVARMVVETLRLGLHLLRVCCEFWVDMSTISHGGNL